MMLQKNSKPILSSQSTPPKGSSFVIPTSLVCDEGVYPLIPSAYSEKSFKDLVSLKSSPSKKMVTKKRVQSNQEMLQLINNK